MSTISLAMIVRDEAIRLRGCLESARPAVDEIVVVDTGSRDETPELARSLGARVFMEAWRDDFAYARNAALDRAGGDWVLVLDADERLESEMPERVRRAVEAAGPAAGAPPVDGLDCRLLSALPAGQPSAAMGSWYCRLFRRRPHVRFEGRIHEQVAPSIRRGGGRIERSAITIVHEGYAVIDAAKIQRNRALLELALADDPHDAFALLNLGLTEQAQGDWVRATAMLERALAEPARPLDLTLRAIAFAHLAECRCAGRRWREAASAAGAALELEPTLGLARYLRGRALFELGEVDAAAACFASCLGEGPDALEMRLHPHLPAMGLAICRLRARRFDDARRVLAPVAEGDATGEALFHLGNSHLGLHRLEDAAAAYRGALARGWRDPDLARRLALCQRLAPAGA